MACFSQHALANKARAEELLAELEKEEIPQQPEMDKEGITEEERYMLRKVGLRMKPFLLLEIEELKADEASAKEKMLRLSIEASECSGFQYNFSLDDKTNADDRVIVRGRVKLVVDTISLHFVKGATVDNVEELICSAFQEKYKKPNYVQISVESYSHLIGLEDQVNSLEDEIKELNEKQSEANSDMITKENLVKQHAKVAEEAV